MVTEKKILLGCAALFFVRGRDSRRWPPDISDHDRVSFKGFRVPLVMEFARLQRWTLIEKVTLSNMAPEQILRPQAQLDEPIECLVLSSFSLWQQLTTTTANDVSTFIAVDTEKADGPM